MHMATGGKILRDLKDEFCECPICTEEYDEDKHVPRLLPCQHSFCTECLKKDIRGGKLTCSMCKRSYKVKDKGIDYFPKDLTKRNLGDVLNRIAAASCRVCNRLEGVKFECTSCNIQVCKSCFKVRKSNDCKNHRFKEVNNDSNETPDSSLDSLEMNAENICDLPHHEKNALKFYCKNRDCRKPICANCTTKDHKNHDWEELDLFYDKEKETLLARLALANKKVETAKGVLSYIKKENEKILQNSRLGKEKIQIEKQNGIDYLNQVVEELCQPSTNIVKEYTEKFDKKETFLMNFIENAHECCSISEKLLKESKLSFLSVEKTISEKLEEFGKESFYDEKSDFDSDCLLLKDECGILKQRIEKMKDPCLEMEENSMFEISPAGETERGVPVVELKKIPKKRERAKSMLTKLTCGFLKNLTCVVAVYFTISLFGELNKWWDQPYCEEEKCDEAYLTFSDNSSHSSFCRSKDGKVASSFSVRHIDQVCGNPSYPFVEGVFLNKTLFFSDGYDVMDFQIHLTDFAEETRGISFFEFGFLQMSVLNYETTGDFGWKLIRSKTEERLELLNTSNVKIYSISATSQSKIVMKFRILKDDINRCIKIINRENKKILDTFHIPEKHYATLFLYFQFCEKSFAKIAVKSLSDKIGFSAKSMYPNIYLSIDNKTARNYISSNQVDVVSSVLIQDLEIHNCKRLCVIPFTISIPLFSLNADQWFDIYFGSIANEEEVLFLSDDTCIMSYILYSLYGYYSKCLSVAKNFADLTIPNLNVNGTFDCVILIDKESNTTSIDINSYRYYFPFPSPLLHSRPVLRIKVYTASGMTVSLWDKRKYLYKFSILNRLLVSKIVSYVTNQLELLVLLVVSSVFIVFIVYKCMFG